MQIVVTQTSYTGFIFLEIQISFGNKKINTFLPLYLKWHIPGFLPFKKLSFQNYFKLKD